MQETEIKVFNGCRELTKYEQWETEFEGISEVYFTSTEQFSTSSQFYLTRGSFRLDNGYYRVIVGDSILYRYEILNTIGQGANAVVVACFDHKHKNRVAIKIKYNDRENICREANLLSQIHETNASAKDYIVNVYATYIFRNFRFLVMEQFITTLHDYIALDNTNSLPEEEVKPIVESLLESLLCVHKMSMIHADVKPRNIILSDDNHLKLIDFDSAAYEGECDVDANIQTRPYRAPEVILELQPNKSIDMWSVGCITFELMTGRCLFPVWNLEPSIKQICQVIGPPSRDLVRLWRSKSDTAKRYFYQSGLPVYRLTSSKTFQNEAFEIVMTERLQMFEDREHSPEVLEFIRECLDWDPSTRITCAAALKHEWLSG